MYQRILVPLDGSELAEQVLPYIRILGKGLGARIELLRVFDRVPSGLAEPAHRVYLDQVVLSVHSEVKVYLEGVTASLEKDGLTVSCTVHEGDHASHVASYIVSEGEREPATLTAMSAHGRSGIGRWLLGSVADKVLHATPSPLLLIRPRQQESTTPQAKLKTIIVPLDGSAFAEEVLPYARDIARAAGAGLALLRVADEEGEIPEAREYVEALARELGVEGKVSLARTDVINAVLEEASRDPRALVAMTSHGRTGLLEALLGNVALSVVRNSGRPVLIYRPRGDSRGRLRRDAKIERVVLPLDGSAFSERMIPEAVEMAKSLKAHLALVHVVSTDVKMPPCIPAGDVLESSYIHSQAEGIEKTYGVQPDWDVLHGDPGEAICRYLEGQHDAMLAMSSHSRRGLGRTIFGGVTSECLRRSGSPLLVLWPDYRAEACSPPVESTPTARV